MSDQPEELRICPYCGQPNSIYSLRCIRCGQELEDLFKLEGFEPSTDPANETPEDELAPMAEILASLDESPLLADEEKPGEESQEESEESEEEQSEDDKDAPDWLERIRQRAKEEEDAAGELAKGGIAMDDRRSQEGRKQVDEAFDEIMRRIREQNEREKARRTRRVESDLVDENGDPEWLRRIRELHPTHQETSQVVEPTTFPTDKLDDEWTEEELQELLRREVGPPESPDAEAEEEITTEVTTAMAAADESEPVLSEIPVENLEGEEEAAAPIPEVFHNIPEDDEEALTNLAEDKELSEKVEKDQAVDENRTDEEPETLSEEAAQGDENLISEVQGEPEEKCESELEEEAVEAGESEKHDVPAGEEHAQTDEEAPSDEEPLSTEEILPDLLLLRNQRDRAKVFTDIIGQEGRRTMAVLHETTRQGKIGRLVLALLLILGVLVAILAGSPGSVELPSPAPAAAFANNLESIASGDDVLIVLDYQAATRNDIEPLAARTLEILEEKGIEARVVTSNPENIWLASTLLDPAQIPDEFIPGGMLGYLALATGDSSGWGGLPINRVFKGEPDLFSEVEQVILFSDSAEFVRMWLEQISPWHTKIKTSAITTSVSAPILLPYHDSGQLQGFVAGIADANSLNIEPQNLVNQRAFQVGVQLMFVVLLLGMIMKADEDSQRRSEERKK